MDADATDAPADAAATKMDVDVVTEVAVVETGEDAQAKGHTEQHFNGVAHSWCHWCTRWMPDHGTHTHPVPAAQVSVAAASGGGGPLQVSPHTTFVVSPTPQAHFAAMAQSTKLNISGN